MERHKLHTQRCGNNGKTAVVTSVCFSKAHILLLPADLKKIPIHASARARINRFDFDGKLVCAERTGKGIDATAVTEYGGLPAVSRFDGQKTDLLSGRIFENSAEIKPFETLLLR